MDEKDIQHGENNHEQQKKLIKTRENSSVQDENVSVMSDVLGALGFKSQREKVEPSVSNIEVTSMSDIDTDTDTNEDYAEREVGEVTINFNPQIPPIMGDGKPAKEVEKVSKANKAQKKIAHRAISHKASSRQRSRKAVAILVIIVFLVFSASAIWINLPYLTEPSPPNPDVVAEYNNKYVLVSDLHDFIALEGAKEYEHSYCEIHGYDHSKCDPSEPCEAHPVDSLEGYREMATRFAVEQMIQEWADKKGITQREEVQHGLKDMFDEANIEKFISQIHVEELSPDSIPKWEVQQYYDENRATYGNTEFSAVEGEIRDLLVEKRHETYLPEYIEELKKSSGLEVNFELLRISEPTDEQILSYYNANMDDFKIPENVEVLEIIFDSKDIADRAVRMLGSGTSFDSVAAEYGQSGSASKRTINKGASDIVLESTVLRLAKDEVSDLIVGNDGTLRIVKLTAKNDESTTPLSNVRAEISEILIFDNMERDYALRKDEALFSVHSRRYTLGDFYMEFKELPPEYQAMFSSYDSKKDLLEQFIAQELLLEETNDASSGSSETEQHRIEEMRIEYLSQILHQEEVEGKITDPTEEEMRAYYEINKPAFISEEAAKINIIFIDAGANGEKLEQARKRANEAITELDAGISFPEVVKKYSELGAVQNEGQWVHREDLSVELGNRIFSLKVGETTGPFEMGNAVYLVKLDERTEAGQRTYEESIETITQLLRSEQHEQLEASMEKTLLEESGFIIYEKTLRRLLRE